MRLDRWARGLHHVDTLPADALADLDMQLAIGKAFEQAAANWCRHHSTPGRIRSGTAR